MSNNNLHAAKRAKNDEFYTQFRDVEREMMSYVAWDADVFRGKTILLPADDPEWSAFTRFFAAKFDELGIAKVISTSYNKDGGRGKVFTLEQGVDLDGDGRVDLDDLRWEYLEGDGDFRSAEVMALRDEADIIVTNPPFSLFREFLAWTVEADKKFLIIGNKNAITYKEVWPLVQAGKMWIGARSMSKDMLFDSDGPVDTDALPKSAYRIVDGGKVFLRAAAVWFTNLDHARRHEPLMLMSLEDNKRFGKKVRGSKVAYRQYDNYDAIEVPATLAIPADYDGVMGVPISYLDKHNPDQFEIVGFDGDYPTTKTYGKKERVVDGVRKKSNTGTLGCVVRVDSFGKGTHFDVGYPVKAIYKRIFIKRK
jgi:hypothetical protein